jgi:hypothetical protein
VRQAYTGRPVGQAGNQGLAQLACLSLISRPSPRRSRPAKTTVMTGAATKPTDASGTSANAVLTWDINA